MVDWWTCKERRYNWASVDLRTSLADLIKLIHKVTGSQVVVLIDEYDHPFDVTSNDKDTMQVTADVRVGLTVYTTVSDERKDFIDPEVLRIVLQCRIRRSSFMRIYPSVTLTFCAQDNEGLKFALLVGVSGAPAKDWSTAINSLTVC